MSGAESVAACMGITLKQERIVSTSDLFNVGPANLCMSQGIAGNVSVTYFLAFSHTPCYVLTLFVFKSYNFVKEDLQGALDHHPGQSLVAVACLCLCCPLKKKKKVSIGKHIGGKHAGRPIPSLMTDMVTSGRRARVGAISYM